MPLTLPPISRRRFLAGGLAVGSTFWLGETRRLRGDEHDPQPAIDPDCLALLSDCHIAADPTHVSSGSNMFDHLRQAVAEIVALPRRPAAAIVNGDLAFKTGQAADYARFVELLRPLREAGLAVHLALGNHDHRERFWEAFPADAKADRPVENRHVLALPTPRADFFLLDTLDHTNGTPGVVGETQLAWLARSLDAAAEKTPGKPAIVFTHHPPRHNPPKELGLIDWEALLAVLLPRKQVKLHFFGHTHHWSVDGHEGLHQVNLPATGYVFKAGEPCGWVALRLAAQGATIELWTLDPNHPKQGEKVPLAWR